MSELKEHQFCESDEFFREYPGPLSNELRLYYLKSDADKVIADLKAENEKLNAQFYPLYEELKRVKDENERLNNALDKERSETIKYMDELCNAKNEIERLTIDKRNAELVADVADATNEKLKAENAVLKQKLEDAKAEEYK